MTSDNPVCENGLQNEPVVSAPKSEPIVVRRGGGRQRKSVEVWTSWRMTFHDDF